MESGWNAVTTPAAATTAITGMVDSTGAASTVNFNYTSASLALTNGAGTGPHGAGRPRSVPAGAGPVRAVSGVTHAA